MSRNAQNQPYGYARLADYSRDVLTIRCTACPERFGKHHLGRLVKKMGPNADLNDVADALIRCRWRRPGWDRPPRKYVPRCLAMFCEWRG